jgi:heat shock protein HslJ
MTVSSAPLWRRWPLHVHYRTVQTDIWERRRPTQGPAGVLAKKRQRCAAEPLRTNRSLAIPRGATETWAADTRMKDMNRAFFRIAIVLAALGGLGYAHAQKKDDEPPKPLPPLQKNFPLDQTWSLRELNGKPVPSTLDVSLKIDGALHGSGFAGCNSWSAVMYPIKDQHLAVGQYALTKKQCDKDTMAIETGFLSALLASPAWDLVNGELVIKGPRGALRLVRSL